MRMRMLNNTMFIYLNYSVVWIIIKKIKRTVPILTLLWLIQLNWICCNSLSWQALEKSFIFSNMGRQPSRCYIFPWCDLPNRPHITRLFLLIIPKSQTPHHETCNSRWLESSHWTKVHTNIKRIIFVMFATPLLRIISRVCSRRDVVSLKLALKKNNEIISVDSIKFWNSNVF